MESLTTLPCRRGVCRKLSVGDVEVSSWKRNGHIPPRIHYYSHSQSKFVDCEPHQVPELLSCHVNGSTSVSSQSLFHQLPKCSRKSSLPASTEKSRMLRRSASGSQIVTTDRLVYAGARFSEAPSPKLLPLPPRHWLDRVDAGRPAVCGEMTKQLKSVLQVV